MTIKINQNDILYYTTKDIYDNEGLLLLKKGQKLTPDIKARLKKFGINNPEKYTNIYDKDVKLTPRKRQNTVFNPEDTVKKFAKRQNISNNYFIDKASELLIDIIFKSKTEPWWIYINALSKYVDWIYTHSIDVAIISLMMAIELGYSDEELNILGIGAILHDAGRLLIPKSIIQKPRNLTETEMDIVKQHCELGVIALEGYHLPKEYMDVIIQHHERLDGSGYPNGLKGDEISQHAKIVIIADAIDANTSYRPYKEPQKMETALRKLRAEKGKYPQELVSILEKIMK